MDLKAFGERLRARREARGWTQKDLARAVGMDHRQISRYESGHTQPLMATMMRLVRALDCTLDDLTKTPPRGRSAETSMGSLLQRLEGAGG